MIDMLDTRKLDVIIDTLPINNHKNTTKITLSKLYNCFAYNKKIMKDVKVEKLEDLKKYPLILPSETSSVRIKLNEYIESQNITFNPILESMTTEIIVDMVRRGNGIGYFITNVIDNQNDKENFEIINFNNKLPAVDVCCVYIDDFLTTASKKFIDLLLEDKTK